jgi:hypothetical protein
MSENKKQLLTVKGRMKRLVSLFEKVGFEMLPTGNGKFIVEDPTGGDGLQKLGDQFASLPRYEIDTASGIGGQDCWLAPDQDPSGEWVRWEDIEKIIGANAQSPVTEGIIKALS